MLENSFPEVLAALDHVYAVAGKTEKAEEVIDESKQRAQRILVFPYHIAIIYAGLHQNEPAFAWLEKAEPERSFFMSWLKVDPAVDNLRDDPRFAPLLTRVGLDR